MTALKRCLIEQLRTHGAEQQVTFFNYYVLHKLAANV